MNFWRLPWPQELMWSIIPCWDISPPQSCLNEVAGTTPPGTGTCRPQSTLPHTLMLIWKCFMVWAHRLWPFCPLLVWTPPFLECICEQIHWRGGFLHCTEVISAPGFSLKERLCLRSYDWGTIITCLWTQVSFLRCLFTLFRIIFPKRFVTFVKFKRPITLESLNAFSDTQTLSWNTWWRDFCFRVSQTCPKHCFGVHKDFC